MSVLLDGKIPGFLPISRYPATRRDLSILIDQSIPSKIILDCVREAAGPVLTKLELFDEYRGENIDSMRKSLAFGLTLQETSRTLRDEEVESIMARVMSSLEKNFKAQLRN